MVSGSFHGRTHTCWIVPDSPVTPRLREAYEAGRVALDPVAYEACLLRLADTTTCFSGNYPACTARWTGHVAEESSCFIDAECEGDGARCVRNCMNQCCAGTCEEVAELGEPCGAAVPCAAGLHCPLNGPAECVSGDRGTACESSLDCDVDDWCDDQPRPEQSGIRREMPVDQRIIDLQKEDRERIDQIARFLTVCFKKYSPGWLPTFDAALEEVEDSLAPGRRSRVLIDENGNALGWGGAIVQQHVWEIHPLAVAPDAQHRGLGKMLVNDLCDLARAHGALAVWAGTGDETGSTSFSHVDLYRDAAHALASFQVPPDHAVQFWLKVGFSVVGLLPDAEGPGRPSIHLAKRIRPEGVGADRVAEADGVVSGQRESASITRPR